MHHPFYKNGLISGMDISSAVAVHALSIQPNDHVLDLCCAPGGKLLFISDLQGASGTGTVTGVDFSQHRLSTCKCLCQKYKLKRYRLFHQDGTLFNVYAPSRIGNTQLVDGIDSQVKCSSMTLNPFYSSRLIRFDPQLQHESLLYDKVLVDAECTHDGSIAHLIKMKNKNWVDVEKAFDPQRLKDLKGLQRNLISNGFKLLKPGGILVYSTCSFAKSQNEEIVSWFLNVHKNAKLEVVPNADLLPCQSGSVQESDLKHVLRFNPSVSNTSGLFIARIRKH